MRGICYSASMRALLIGNYGVGNCGDELLRQYFEERFSDIDWVVVSERPKKPTDVPRLPLRPHLIYRGWHRTLRAFWNCDCVVFGGGTLYTDVESLRAVLLWWVYAMVGWLFRKPLVFAFQGVGPFRTRLGRVLSVNALRKAAFLSVRDDLSLARVREMRLRVPIHPSFDPVILLLKDVPPPAHIEGLLGIILRKNSPVAFADEAEALAKQWKSVTIILYEPDTPSERVWAKKLQERIPGATVQNVRTLDDAVRVVGACSAVLSMRLHGSIVAHALGVQVITRSQASGDKHAAFEKLIREAGRDGLIQRALIGEKALKEYFED